MKPTILAPAARVTRVAYCSTIGMAIGSMAIGSAMAAGSPGPAASAAIVPIAAPLDRPYPGAIELHVDASDTSRRIIHVRETISGIGPDSVLLYPKWLPGTHAPEGTIDRLAGIKIVANGAPVSWTRDPVDVFAFRLHGAPGLKSIDIDFDYLSPTSSGVGELEISRELMQIEWNELLLYPAGYFVRRIPVQASITLPADWKYATALEPSATDGARIQFKPVSLNTFVDSPLDAGRHALRLDLDPGSAVPVHLDLFRRPAGIAGAETGTARGAPRTGAAGLQAVRFASLRSLRLSVHFSDQIQQNGLEHHQSSETAAIRPPWSNGTRRRTPAICWRTNSPIRGTASSAARRTYGHRTTTCRCRTACCGSTRGRPSTGARCWPRARGSGTRSRHSISWR
jgi:hypothetical protein